MRLPSLVDQPAGTGFSYAPSNKFDHELPEVSSRTYPLGSFMTIPGGRSFCRVPPQFLQRLPRVPGRRCTYCHTVPSIVRFMKAAIGIYCRRELRWAVYTLLCGRDTRIQPQDAAQRYRDWKWVDGCSTAISLLPGLRCQARPS